MARFFVENAQITSGTAFIGDVLHIRALRLRPGDALTLCDGNGTDYDCVLRSVDRGGAVAEVLSSRLCASEPEVAPDVFLAYAKGERLEYAVQKCVELGAKSFTLFPSARVVALPDMKSLPGKLTRLRNIAKSAAEQSGRGIIPEVRAADSFSAAADEAARADLPLFPYEREQNVFLRALLRERTGYRTVSVLTGAEGGFTPEEAEYAVSRGLLPVSLGRLILRCDTAPVAVCAAVMLN